jgi:hypothetical protein
VTKRSGGKIRYGVVVVHTPPTHATLTAAPAATVLSSSVVVRSQQQPQGGAPPHVVSNALNASFSAVFKPIASM